MFDLAVSRYRKIQLKSLVVSDVAKSLQPNTNRLTENESYIGGHFSFGIGHGLWLFCLITREHMHAYCHGAPSSIAKKVTTLAVTALPLGNGSWLLVFCSRARTESSRFAREKVCALAYTCQACLGGSSKAKCFYSMYMVPSSTHCLRSGRTRTNVLGKILQCV